MFFFELFVFSVVMLGGAWGFLSLVGQGGMYKRCSVCRNNGLTEMMECVSVPRRWGLGVIFRHRYFHYQCASPYPE